MGRLADRVAIVTGAGRGLGREHALALAAEGAAVVVNDLGADVHGEGAADESPAQEVVDLIRASGGHAVVSGHDVADWDQAEAMVDLAVETFGQLDVLVNNAGIVRDRTLANMSEAEWDAVIDVQLKGHAAPTRHAVAHWRRRAKAGETFDASVVMTSSIAGFAGNFGQANYSSAKLAVLALSATVAMEAGPFGVRSNAVSPSARTRIALSVPGAADDPAIAVPGDGSFDPYDPAHVSPLVVWLATPDCPATGQVFHLGGDRLLISSMPPLLQELRKGRRWTLEDFDADLKPALVAPLGLQPWMGES
jgi:NAD(P)-dependent dehydrogenase (short-subunit alcohol dehydrogenase family)